MARSLARPRRLAIATACATFCLLLIGGLVHNTRSSLACPDWPLCFGSAFPRMVGGVFYEHSHRLAATTVGLCTIALAALLARRGARWLKLGLVAVGLVVFQGVLGGITVLYRLPPAVSTTHLATSLVFFSYLLWLSFRLREAAPRPALLSPSLRGAIAAAAALVYLQCLLGALMRHLGAGLGCVDQDGRALESVVLCQGALWPASATFAVQLHLIHRVFALLVGGVACAVGVQVARRARGPGAEARRLRRLGLLLPGIVLVQILLGVASIVTFLDVIPVTAHLGGAALLLGDLVILYLGSAPIDARSASPVTAPGHLGELASLPRGAAA